METAGTTCTIAEAGTARSVCWPWFWSGQNSSVIVQRLTACYWNKIKINLIIHKNCTE